MKHLNFAEQTYIGSAEAKYESQEQGEMPYTLSFDTTHPFPLTIKSTDSKGDDNIICLSFKQTKRFCRWFAENEQRIIELWEHNGEEKYDE